MSNISALRCGVAVLALALPVAGMAQQAASPADLVRSVDIPYQRFTLANGLRVIVHTDRSAPVVAVDVTYDVGSRNEPAGKTGFAHLFEHLMFNGSENAPGDFGKAMSALGATDENGSTNNDRTNYFETVPTTALDRALFLESDRMGWFANAVTQTSLDEQRGVVQNEKRQHDNPPYGMVNYTITEGLFPADHPYGHTTIGSMADLDRATLDDVRAWFRGHYGPNNAVLTLSGDIDAATARTLVERYFGAIPAGPRVVRPDAPIPAPARTAPQTMTDRIAAPMLVRGWATPGTVDPVAPALGVLAGVMGGMETAFLREELVRRQRLFSDVSIGNQSSAQVGMMVIQALVAPGVDVAKADRALDAAIATFLKTGPSADAVQRYVVGDLADYLRNSESVGRKAGILVEGELQAGDPGFYKRTLLATAQQTPATVRAAAQAWLGRPAYRLTVLPGERAAYTETTVAEAKPAAATAAVVAPPAPPIKGTRGAMPPVGGIGELSFPAVERTRLSNGIELIYARRTSAPLTGVSFSFDAGIAADPAGGAGTQNLMLTTINEGTPTRTSTQISQAVERLGAALNGSGSEDRTVIDLSVPSANLAPSIAIVADFLRNASFRPADVDRVRAQVLAGIEQELTDPQGLAVRAIPALLDAASPYANAQGGGDAAVIARLTPAALVAFRNAWIRPDKAQIFVVSDRPLAEVKAVLDRQFGDWAGTGPAGVKTFAATARPASPRIVLIDRPDSPQSFILAGQHTGRKGTDELLAATVGNTALGGNFTSRINMDIRERKHWSYGANGTLQKRVHALPYLFGTSVQADKTGPAIAAVRDIVTGYVTDAPMTQVEFNETINQSLRSLVGEFRGSYKVLTAMQTNDRYHRPDDYFATIASRYRALTLAEARAAIAGIIDPAKFVWVVVGDAAKIRPQLATLGLPIEERTAK